MSNNDSTRSILALSVATQIPTLVNTTTQSPSILTWDEQNLLGYACIALILICSVFYVLVLFIFKTKSFVNRHLSYRIMYHIGLFELFYLWTYILICLMIVMHTDFGPVFGRGLSALRNAIWWTINVLTTILALNRSDSIIGFLPYVLRKNNLLFKHSTDKDRPTFFKILLIMTYISTFVVAACYLIPGFQAENRGLTSIKEEYNKKYLYPTVLFCSFGMFVFSYVLYLISGIKLVMLRCKATTNGIPIGKQEISLFIQSFIICAYKSGLIWLWSYVVISSKAVYFVYWIMSVLENGYAPFMYYIMNRTIRREVNSLFTNPTHSTSVVVIKTP